jgi:hypothetical protein
MVTGAAASARQTEPSGFSPADWMLARSAEYRSRHNCSLSVNDRSRPSFAQRSSKLLLNTAI